MNGSTVVLLATAILACLRSGDRLPAWAASPTRHVRVLIHVATPALIAIAIMSGSVAMTRAWPGGQEEHVSFLAASKTTPVTTAAGAGPAVAYIWEADGGPTYSLDRPTAATIDPQGNVWVTDGANDRFVIFSPDGVALEAWGRTGSGEGEFSFACRGLRYGGVAFDAAGNIYVADAGNGRIQKFAPDRTFLTSWPSEGIVDSQLLVTGRGNQGVAERQTLYPAAIVVDRQDRVYVSNRNAGAIAVFDADGRTLSAAMGKLVLPQAMALDGDGNIWVVDTTNRVLKFAPDGRHLTEWDRYGTGEGEFTEPLGIAVDAEGRVFVSDLGNRVQIFSSDGRFLADWWSRGVDGKPFNEPVALALDGLGNIYVVEQYGPRVQKFRLLPPLGP